MSRVSEMELEDILKQTDIIMRTDDIDFIYDEVTEKQIAQEFKEKFKNGVDARKEVTKFLIESEKRIPEEKRGEKKEKLVLLMVKNYIENIQTIKKYLERLKVELKINKSPDLISNLAKFHMQLHQQEENLVKATKLGKGIKQVIVYIGYDEEQKRYRTEIVDSREVIDGKKVDVSKNLKRFNKIDQAFMQEDLSQEIGLEYVIQSILLTDLAEILKNPELGSSDRLGDNIRAMILQNVALKRNIATREEIDIINRSNQKHAEFIDNIPYDIATLPIVKNTLREYIQYVDIDKLLLISAYRFREFLERKELDETRQQGVKEILQQILNNIKTDKGEIVCEIQDRYNLDLEERMKIKYSIEDIKKCISQFANNIYITSEEIKEYREKMYNDEMKLSDIPNTYVDVIFSKQHLEELSKKSADNLRYVFDKYNWDISKVIELYEANDIPLGYIEELKEYIDFTKTVNFDKLNDYYNNIKENSEDEETLARYENYLKLYKEIYINDKEKEQIQENSNSVIENLVETLEQKEYEQVVKKYYADGIITLDSIVEWSNSNVITNMFNEGILSLEDIRSVGVALGYDYMHNLYTELVYNLDLEYDKRIEYIESGMINSEDVISLYDNGLIMDEDLLKLAQKSVLPLEVAQQTIDNRGLEERIKTARAKALGWSDSNLLFHIDGIEKKHSDGVLYTNIFSGGVRKEKLIIDPNIRQKYIEMLGLYRIETECEENNPFYNYEFYATPDETGAIGANSVIIAERYYTNKYEEKNYATNNATYFFKYKDFLVLSNLQKKDMIKERDNIVFRTNHTISTKERNGTWAENVLHNVLKTMLGSDLADLSKKEKRTKIIEKMSQMYLREECEEILELCEKIDSGEYICNVQGINYSRPKKHLGYNLDDDNEER